jgi:glucan endo-1,3-alpha-glucosidase
MHRLLRLMLRSVSVIPLLLAEASAQTTPLVIANYTQDEAAYGNTIADYQKDIQDAQSMGIDGFELDMMGWGSEVSYFDYQTAVANIFTAAHNLDTNFRLYFMIDCQRYGTICQTAAGAMMAQYASHPNYLHYQGRPVMSSFEASYNSNAGSFDETFWHGVYTAVTGHGITPYYLPSTLNADIVIAPANLASQIIADTTWYENHLKADSNGIAVWGFDVPSVNAANQDALASVLRSNNKTLMATVVPFFSQLRFLFVSGAGAVQNMEQHGAEGLIGSWMDIINNLRPPLVRLQTWNDHTESYANLASTATLTANDVSNWQMPAAALWSHAAYAHLNQYFTRWYKTGTQPANWPDSMYVFYRNGAQALVPSSAPSGTSVNWEPDGVEPTLDDIYITTILRSPATVTVYSGRNTTTIHASSGVNSYRVPFTTGTQSFTVDRGGSALISITGANIVTSESQYYNVNPLAYYGHSP